MKLRLDSGEVLISVSGGKSLKFKRKLGWTRRIVRQCQRPQRPVRSSMEN